ncbi:MAG: hypothetical protein GY938_03945 [Ketobacter sp.]|nr:hypothetical protein [Ketobacter sp.]
MSGTAQWNFGPRPDQRLNLFTFNSPDRGELVLHPSGTPVLHCQTPVALIYDLFDKFCPTNSKILDLGTGTGSAAVAALYHHCSTVALEVCKPHFEAAHSRLLELQSYYHDNSEFPPLATTFAASSATPDLGSSETPAAVPASSSQQPEPEDVLPVLCAICNKPDGPVFTFQSCTVCEKYGHLECGQEMADELWVCSNACGLNE